MLHRESRYCLWLYGASPTDIRSSAVLRDRVSGVQKFRSQSKNARTQALANRPTEFDVDAQPGGGYLCLPCHSSENRRSVPMAFQDSRTIVLDSALSIDGAELWLFGLLESSMFTAWLGAVGGRLKSDFRIAPDLVYNTFPFPEIDDAAKAKLTDAAKSILATRDDYPDSSLADLYDRLAMPSDLSKAHDDLDRIVDSLFASRKKFQLDSDRLAVLFERYEKLTR